MPCDFAGFRGLAAALARRSSPPDRAERPHARPASVSGVTAGRTPVHKCAHIRRGVIMFASVTKGSASSASEWLSIGTLNLRLHIDAWEKRGPLMVEQIAEVHPHLLALQECWLPIRQGEWLAEQLNARLVPRGLAPYTLVQRPKWGFEGGSESVGVLSRLPLVSSAGVDLPGGRVAQSATVDYDGCLLEFVSVHLHFGPPNAADGIRRSQIRTMLGWLDERHHAEEKAGRKVPLTAIAGDFNAPPNSEAVSLMRARWKSAYPAANGREPDWTFGTALADRNNVARGVTPFKEVMDYIFVPPKMKVCRARLFCHTPAPHDPELYASDHIGLVAEVDIQASAAAWDRDHLAELDAPADADVGAPAH